LKLYVRSIKNYKSLLECRTIIALVAAFDAKAFNDTEWLKWYACLAGTGLLISTGNPTDNATVKIFDKTNGLHFL